MHSLPQSKGAGSYFPLAALEFAHDVWRIRLSILPWLFPWAWPNGILTAKCGAEEDMRSQVCPQGQNQELVASSREIMEIASETR